LFLKTNAQCGNIPILFGATLRPISRKYRGTSAALRKSVPELSRKLGRLVWSMGSFWKQWAIEIVVGLSVMRPGAASFSQSFE